MISVQYWKNQIRNKIRNKLGLDESIFSYSQEGEDLILWEYFLNVKSGFYVDVGASHPRKYSNTYLLYKKGWRGINIDARPGSMTLFKKERKKDINLELGVAPKEGYSTFYMFKGPEVNTFDLTRVERLNKQFKLIATQDVKLLPLEDIFARYLPKDLSIDLLDVDVEGLDLEVLQSNNWSKYLPKMILVEDIEAYFENGKLKSKVFDFLQTKGYELFCKTPLTLFFFLKK